MAKIKHVGITMVGNRGWSKKHKTDLAHTYKRSFKILSSIIKQQIKSNIPIMTIYLLPSHVKDSKQLFVLIDSLIVFFKELIESKLLQSNKIKVSVLGKWYDLPSRIVEPIKKLTSITKDYDDFFLNFCINYEGQEEIVDACKLIARKVKLEKIDPEVINKEMIKENIYSSYFIPPSLIIATGKEKKLGSFLLWDSAYTEFYFPNKLWPDFSVKEFLKAVKSK